MFVVCNVLSCLRFVVDWLVFIVLFVGSGLFVCLLVGWLVADRCLEFVVCCVFVCCSLFAACCLLFVCCLSVCVFACSSLIAVC